MTSESNSVTDIVSWNYVIVSFLSSCQVPSQISWVLSAFNLSLFVFIHWSKLEMCDECGNSKGSFLSDGHRNTDVYLHIRAG